jgi:hypothetical protein
MRLAAAAALAIALLLPAAHASAGTADRVLVFARTEGFRHDSIGPGIAMLRRLARGRGLRVEATEDPRRFTDRGLRRYRAVVFLSATGAETGWPFYQDALLGTRFIGHPAIQRATVVVEDRSHPATARLPRRWTRTDEWYSFRPSPRGAVHVVASLDERTYDPGALRMGDHPIAWWRRAGRGRAFYTALGHTTASYTEPAFRRHVLGALAWVTRRR